MPGIYARPCGTQRGGVDVDMIKLDGLARAQAQLDDLDERIQRIRSDLERVTTRLRETPTGGGYGSAIDGKIAALLDAEAEWIARRAELEGEVQRWYAKITLLPEPYSSLMVKRYVLGLPWAEVARRMGYCEAHCYDLHREACEKIVEIENSLVNPS